MATEESETIDVITPIQPAVAVAGASTTEQPPPPPPDGPKMETLTEQPPLHPDETTLEPLDVLEAPKVRTKLRIYAILASLYLVLFVAALNQTVIATAIPTISASLHSAAGYVWIGGAYLLANAATGPIWAKCSDIWGRKPALLGAVAAFAIASIIAAMSTNMSMLIAARALQGTAGGGLMQLVTITISDLFSLRRRAFYIGLLGVMWAVAGSAGPLIGGALTQLVSWRWCFWINLPVCGIAFVLLFLLLDVHNPRTKLCDGIKAVDWFGTLSILAVTVLLLLGLDFGGAAFPWSSPKVICLIVFGTLMIGMFLFSEHRLAKYPLMPLGIFANRSNNATCLLAFAHSMVSIGIEYYLPLYFQSVQRATPLRSGLLIVPMMVTQAAVDILCGVFISRTGRYRETILLGSVLMTAGTALFIIFDAHTPTVEIIFLEILGGIGTALLFQSPTLAIQHSLADRSQTAAATASLGLFRNLATAISLVAGGAVFQNAMDAHQQAFRAAGLANDIRNALSGANAAANVEIVATIHDEAKRRVVIEAFAQSTRWMFVLYTCVAPVAVVASVFVGKRKLSDEDGEGDGYVEAKTGIGQLTRRGGQEE